MSQRGSLARHSRKGNSYFKIADARMAGFSVELGPYEVVVLAIDPEGARAGNAEGNSR